jgi:hypothetical protein
MQINVGSKPLLVHRHEYLDKIDDLAGEVRSRFLTVQPGQELTYLMKLEEAKKYPEGSHPWLDAEAFATGKSTQDLVTSVLASAAAWATVGITIESARMRAKSLVAAASTVKEMYDAYSELKDAIDGL